MTEIWIYWRRLRRLVWRSPEPVTRSVIATNIATFLLRFLGASVLGLGDLTPWLAFRNTDALLAPWTLATYPLITGDVLSLLVSSYVFWFVGGSLERSWTSRRFVRLFAGLTVLTSASITLGTLLQSLASPVPSFALQGLWMPLAALIVAWCQLNPDQIVLMGFVLPMKGRIVQWVVIGLTFFVAAGFAGPWLALFDMAGIAAAYLYTQRRDRWIYTRQRRTRGPNRLEHALDWALYHWERLRRRR